MRTNLIHCLSVCLVLCVASASTAQTRNLPAGRVVTAFGDAFSVDVNNARSLIARRSDIHSGDIIQTLDQAYVQIRMVDSAILALRCQSALSIEEYQFEESEEDQVELRLIAGSVRTITGQISSQNRNSYNFAVGESSVEIRGTDFEVSLQKDGVAYFANYDGGITVSNPQGSVRLGIDGDANFAVVEPGQAPRALSNQPSQLAAYCPTN